VSAVQPSASDRKLAAILSADVVGYSRLMAEDEDDTVRRLRAYRREIAALVEEHRGRLVDFTGDNFLAEFPTATDAVSGAVEIQGVLGVRNASLAEDRKMQFRIGVHLGEVRVEDGRVYGDGVNIAARLEGLAEPGGICMSATVQEQVRHKLELEYENIGEQRVKNILEPVRAYRVRVPGKRAAPRIWSRPVRYAVLAVGVLAVALGALVISRWYSRPVEPWSHTGRRLTIALPDSASLSFVGSATLGLGRTTLDLSPDGRLLAYVGITSGRGTQLYLRSLDRFEVRSLPGSEGAYSPFFSPDSRRPAQEGIRARRPADRAGGCGKPDGGCVVGSRADPVRGKRGIQAVLGSRIGR
jgi:class 3 adenylate cyclase